MRTVILFALLSTGLLFLLLAKAPLSYVIPALVGGLVLFAFGAKAILYAVTEFSANPKASSRNPLALSVAEAIHYDEKLRREFASLPDNSVRAEYVKPYLHDHLARDKKAKLTDLTQKVTDQFARLYAEAQAIQDQTAKYKISPRYAEGVNPGMSVASFYDISTISLKQRGLVSL